MKNAKLILAALLMLTVIFSIPAEGKDEVKAKPVIQIAILLDTSNSMDGLIDQAKTKLWSVVNELATTRKKGVRPDFQVALYEYGKSSISREEGHLRMILPLTTDLDKVSEELFDLKTNGGQEYCGKVIKAAVEGLQWSSSSSDYKAIFIAGNEPFTQGDVDYKAACKEAIQKSIMVNTIFCGAFNQGEKTGWKDGALLADGSYMNINQNATLVHISAPQDDELARLSAELNKTYIAFGAGGRARKERQMAQDSNAEKKGKQVLAARAATKASGMYKNDEWDLVDAVKEGKKDVDEVAEEDLPEEMKNMDSEEKKEYIEQKQKERAEIQEKIRKLSEARKKFIAEKRKAMSSNTENTLEEAMVKAIRAQVVKKDFEIK